MLRGLVQGGLHAGTLRLAQAVGAVLAAFHEGKKKKGVDALLAR